MASPTRSLRGRRLAPLPSQYTPYSSSSSIRSMGDDVEMSASTTEELSAESVRDYLRRNTHFLEEYISREVEPDVIERLLTNKPRGDESAVLHCTTSCAQQRTLNESLVTLTKLMLEDTPNTEAILHRIQLAATELVNADRASIFLVDHKDNELYAYVFGVGPEETESLNRVVKRERLSSVDDYIEMLGQTLTEVVAYKGNEVRIPLEKGVGGYVARTGRLENTSNAQTHPYFCPEVDELTGYQTSTILCTPLKEGERVIGVLQAVNKINGVFTVEDEQTLEAFGHFCALILHNSSMQNEIQRLENRHKVTTEILSYQRQGSEVEFQKLKALPQPDTHQYAVASFDLNTTPISDDTKIKLFPILFRDIVHPSMKFDEDKLLRFTITVSKNYRRLPYHNWDHSFHVAQCMYAILKGSPERFSQIETVAFFVGCLCHDLDHRGLNNAFLVKTEHPLASLYCSSILENHHISQMLALLHIEEINIFSSLPEQQYKQILEVMRRAILATDLALFFGNKAALHKIVTAGEFTWDNQQHRELVHCLMMTISDLCCTCKPWESHREGVKLIFQEFYTQGDMEKAMGTQPLRMMDSDCKDELATCQVGFLKSITIPCCELLTVALPHLQPLLDGALNNLRHWEEDMQKPQ